MKKLALLLFFFATHPLLAQQDRFNWRLGAKSGVMSYFGDLNSRFLPANQALIDKDFDFLSYGISLEKRLKQTSMLRISISRGQFIANDRAIDFDGNLVNDPFLARSLNAKTNIQEASVHYIWYADNDRLLSKKAFIAPYFGLGAGLSLFEVFGDVRNKNGDFYFYWSDGTIRDLPEILGNGQIVEQDGTFETNLSDLQTEGNNYSTITWFGSALIGLKFRLNSRINLNLEYQWNLTFSDYLDDVSGDFQNLDDPFANYAANPANYSGKRGNDSNIKDSYAFLSVGLHYNLGKRKTPFKAPEIFTSPLDAKQDNLFKGDSSDFVVTATIDLKKDSLTSKELPFSTEVEGPITSVDTLYQVPDSLLKSSDKLLTLEDTPLDIGSKMDSLSLIETGKTAIVKEDSIVKTPIKETILFSAIPANTKTKATTDLTDNQLSTEKTSFTSSPNPSNEKTVTTSNGVAVSDERVAKMEDELIALKAQVALLTQLQVQKAVANPQDSSLKVELGYIREDLATIKATQVMIQDSVLQDSTGKTSIVQVVQSPASDTQTKALLLIQQELQQVNQRLGDLKELQAEEKSSNRNAQEVKGLQQEMAALSKQVNALEAQNKQLSQQLKDINTNPVVSENVKTDEEKFGLYQKTVIYFGNNISQLTPADQQRLDALVTYSKKQEVSMVIRGYTDQVGNAKYNEQLATKRAQAVQNYLLAKGWPAAKLFIDHVGPDTSLGYQHASYGRRVEVLLR